jgi:hypothetical protein
VLSLLRFARYARAFEKTLRDDDWERVRPFFCDDAVYEVVDETYGCRLEGFEAIAAGIRKSLDNFDRRFPRRSVHINGLPKLGWNRVEIGWTATYEDDESTSFVLAGVSEARYRGGRIAHLGDTFAGDPRADIEAWMTANEAVLDPSYG